MVEVRVLQVRLSDDKRHGVNLEGLVNSASPKVDFKTQAFATTTGPGAIFSVDGGRFDQVIDLLNSTNDAKTLAAPKITMINGRESRIQIGQRLAYTTSTTTQTVTVQGVQFLDVGVLLTVTPHITDDGNVILQVHPKVSSGQINPNNDLPEEETTELRTSIMVPDGNGVMLGGLIQEIDIERQSKLPVLGDIWVVGRLFQRRSTQRERAEVIIALKPQIIPGLCSPDDSMELDRAYAPLLTPGLKPAARPEPHLHDAMKRPLRNIRGSMH
jgi:type II secretory pathway component GspD/PulD (secretin)